MQEACLLFVNNNDQLYLRDYKFLQYWEKLTTQQQK